MLGKILGIGGFAVTYLALDLRLCHPVAVKEYSYCGSRKRDVISQATQRMQRVNRKLFSQEAKVLAAFSGLEGVVQIHDYFWEQDTAYIVMEYISGQTLLEYVRENGPIAFQEAVSGFRPILQSLQYLHKKGVLHRDLSPDNICIRNTGIGKGKYVLCDFGGVLLHSQKQKRNGAEVSFKKAGFTSPEQAENSENVGPWSDVYSIAATMYYCITAQIPPDCENRQQGKQVLAAPSKLGAKISGKEEKVLQKALTLRPENRYSSMAELIDALSRSSTEHRIRTSQKRSTRILQSISVLLLMIAAFLICLFCVMWPEQTIHEKEKIILSADRLSVGAVIEMGTCEQDGYFDTGKEPIEWIVLAIRENVQAADGYQGKAALLISKKALFIKEFDNVNNGRRKDLPLNWNSCTLRRILTDTSEDAAIWPEQAFETENTMLYQWFDEKERSVILKGVTLPDALFILSEGECMQYLDTPQKRQAALTAYAASLLQERMDGNTADAEENWCYLTRTMLSDTLVVQLDQNGEVNTTTVDNGNNAIRPALWIALSQE